RQHDSVQPAQGPTQPRSGAFRFEQVLIRPRGSGPMSSGPRAGLMVQGDPRRPTMKQFQPLIGEWHGEGEVPMERPMKISMEAKIEHLGEFIVISSVGEPAEVPDSISIIGGAPPGEPQPMHYFDSRGVKRLFMMALEGSTWKIWRAPGEDWNGPNGPGFHQRFICEIVSDGKS